MVRVILGAFIGLCLLAGRAEADSVYPDRAITLVTPYAAGGGSDIITRILAKALSQNLGKSVVVQNQGGAGGVIGSQFVALAKPDGYTLLLHHIGLATSPALYPNLKFDPIKSFEPVGLFADTPMILVANKDFAPNNMKELVDYVQTHNVTFASSGMGSATYLCALLFEHVVGKEVTMVQYRGAGPALLDVESGRVNLLCDVTAGIANYVRSGSVKGYALTAERRLDSLPKLPTSAEAGFKNITMSAWYGLYAPAGTPAPIIERLSKALQAINADPAIKKQLATIETFVFTPAQGTPAALRERLAAQIQLWTPIIKKAGAAAAAQGK
jgi:tripartite-type tricarboxylate transporter receptor subunit TctC